MSFIKRFFRNIIIFVFATAFSIAIVFLVKHPDLLQASVLNANETSLIQKNKWDIAYKQNENILDIFFSAKTKIEPISIILAHSDSIELELTKTSGQCPFTIINSNKETTEITIECEEINQNESVLLIPFKGNIQDILIEEATYTNNKTKTNLSIGNISSIFTHSK